MKDKNISIQSVQRQRRLKSFVGRGAEIEDFHQNQILPLSERRYIWNIYGQGGIGKTSLLRRYLTSSTERGAVTAIVDETQANMVEVMAAFVAELERQGKPSKSFSDRYHKLRELKQQVESDPHLPAGMSTMLGRVVGKAGVGLVRQIPVAGVAVDLLGEEALVQKASELTAYLAQRIGNKDEVQLVLEPTEVLTPLFIQDISKIAATMPVVLGFDTFEQTGSFLDGWLRQILEGKYGDLDARVLLIVAGREKLSEQWADYAELMHSVSLNVLSESEARELLAARSINDEKTVQLILKLSGRIPLWLATLASQVPTDGHDLADPTDGAIERFLKWVKDEDKHRAAVICALPSRLDRDVVSILLGAEKGGHLFDWLKTQPFVEQKATEGWAYHELVRNMMLRHVRTESWAEWRSLNLALSKFYVDRRDEIGVSGVARFNNKEWITFDQWSIYHSICADPNVGVAALAEKLVSAIPRELKYARGLADTAFRAGRALENSDVTQWGNCIVRGVDAYLGKQERTAVSTLLDKIEQTLPANSPQRVELIREQARMFEVEDHPEAALAACSRAIGLLPDTANLYTARASVWRKMGNFEQALADYTRAIELSADGGDTLIARAGFLKSFGRNDEALRDFTEAIQKEPQNAEFFEDRARMYESMARYDEALNDQNHAVELEPKNIWRWIRRAQILIKLGENKKALADYDKAFEIKPEDFIAGWRGDLFFELGRYEEACADFTRAIELRDAKPRADLDNPRFKIGDRVAYVGPRDFEGRHARVLEAMGRDQEAIAEYSRAIDRGDSIEKADYLRLRGSLYQKLNESDKGVADKMQAIAEYTASIEALGERVDLLAYRAELLQELGKMEEALRDYSRCIDLKPQEAYGWGSRSNLLGDLGRYQEALDDFQRAYELEPQRTLLWDYQLAGLLSHVGRYEDALQKYDQLLESQPTNESSLIESAIALAKWKSPEEALGRIQKARDACEALLNTAERSTGLYGLACLDAVTGNADGALSHLRQAILEDSKLAKFACDDIAFVGLLQDRRFQALVPSRESKQSGI